MTTAPLLLLDAGNSRLKWACVVPGTQAVPVARVCEYEAIDKLKALMPAGLVRALGCNVAGPDVAARLASALAPIQIEWLRPTEAMAGVRNGYQNPAQLGADRWAALIGARARYAGCAVVVMAGTAMTVDALTEQGVFLGGIIVPGFRLMRESLSRGTAELGLPEGGASVFPQSTGEAIVNGALRALSGAIREMVDRLQQVAGQTPMLFLSGGDATRLQPELTWALADRVVHVDNLVLDGLAKLSAKPDLHPTPGRKRSP